MAVVNHAEIQGTLSADPMVRVTPNGNHVASFTLIAGRAGPIYCCGWQNIAHALKMAHKGDTLTVEGRLQTRSYQSGDQTKRVTEIVCDRIDFGPDHVLGVVRDVPDGTPSAVA